MRELVQWKSMEIQPENDTTGFKTIDLLEVQKEEIISLVRFFVKNNIEFSIGRGTIMFEDNRVSALEDFVNLAREKQEIIKEDSMKCYDVRTTGMFYLITPVMNYMSLEKHGESGMYYFPMLVPGEDGEDTNVLKIPSISLNTFRSLLRYSCAEVVWERLPDELKGFFAQKIMFQGSLPIAKKHDDKNKSFGEKSDEISCSNVFLDMWGGGTGLDKYELVPSRIRTFLLPYVKESAKLYDYEFQITSGLKKKIEDTWVNSVILTGIHLLEAPPSFKDLKFKETHVMTGIEHHVMEQEVLLPGMPFLWQLNGIGLSDVQVGLLLKGLDRFGRYGRIGGGNAFNFGHTRGFAEIEIKSDEGEEKKLMFVWDTFEGRSEKLEGINGRIEMSKKTNFEEVLENHFKESVESFVDRDNCQAIELRLKETMKELKKMAG